MSSKHAESLPQQIAVTEVNSMAAVVVGHFIHIVANLVDTAVEFLVTI